MSHPYKNQPDSAFWRTAVEGRHPFELTDLYSKKFDIDGLPLATAGSCFAQHISRHLKRRALNFLDTEPAPALIPKQLHTAYGYGLFSARFGNIYTVRHLLQLARRAFGDLEFEGKFWPRAGGFVDPFRPTIEPEPFRSLDELQEQREFHLRRVRALFESLGVLIFTMGLTEGWVDKVDGAVYPVVPGTSAGGIFDESRHAFHNFSYLEILTDLEDFFAILKTAAPKAKLILTVSPVPLAATATSHHVVSATIYSKAVLRAAAGDFAARHDDVDYFPSFELTAAHSSRGFFFNPDMRTVSQTGVDRVMSYFFAAHFPEAAAEEVPAATEDGEAENSEVVCDEELMANFARRNYA